MNGQQERQRNMLRTRAAEALFVLPDAIGIIHVSLQPNGEMKAIQSLGMALFIGLQAALFVLEERQQRNTTK